MKSYSDIKKINPAKKVKGLLIYCYSEKYERNCKY